MVVASENINNLAIDLQLDFFLVSVLLPTIFRLVIFEARIMPSRRYRKNAEECLDRAAQARKSQDKDAWLATAEEWQKLAEELDAEQPQFWKFWKRRSP